MTTPTMSPETHENLIRRCIVSEKAEAPMLWVQKMNNIRNAAMEIISNDLIYA